MLSDHVELSGPLVSGTGTNGRVANVLYLDPGPDFGPAPEKKTEKIRG